MDCHGIENRASLPGFCDRGGGVLGFVAFNAGDIRRESKKVTSSKEDMRMKDVHHAVSCLILAATKAGFDTFAAKVGTNIMVSIRLSAATHVSLRIYNYQRDVIRIAQTSSLGENSDLWQPNWETMPISEFNRMEFSFLVSEIEKSIAWLMKNFPTVKTTPEWAIHQRFLSNVPIGGSPSYFWSKKGWDHAESHQG